MHMTNEGERITVFLDGDIDHHSVTFIRSEIDLAVELSAPKTLILDFGKVDFMDSSGIGLILGRLRRMKSIDGQLWVKNTGEYVRKIIKLSGLSALIIP